VQLNTKVTKAQWEESKGQWKVTVEHEGNARDEWADVLISGQGALE
jgi:cation diffusion facilitator CzcD-associated flavoprotein CzcO